MEISNSKKNGLGFVTVCNYRHLQLEGGWLNLLLLIANRGLTQGRVVQCPH